LTNQKTRKDDMDQGDPSFFLGVLKGVPREGKKADSVDWGNGGDDSGVVQHLNSEPAHLALSTRARREEVLFAQREPTIRLPKKTL